MDRKIKAGALQLTIFIVVMIALLLTGFLIFIHTQKHYKIQSGFLFETIESADKGIYHSLNHWIPIEDSVQLEQLSQSYRSVLIHRDFWGVHEKIISVSKIKKHTFKKAALIGSAQPDNQIALFVEDNNKPLVLVGETLIKGNVVLPRQGVRPGNISGNSYYNDRLIYGSVATSGAMPQIPDQLLSGIKTMGTKVDGINQKQFLDISKVKQFKNSFLEPLNVVFSKEDIILEHIKMTGHILIQSENKITVSATAKLQDVVLIAPEIEIQDHVTGTFQTIAKDKITVGENTVLNYPSAIILYSEKDSDHSEGSQFVAGDKILMKKNSTVKGIVAYLGKYDPNNYQPQVLLEEGATIRGELFCNGNIELKGEVYGAVYTSNFVAHQFGSIYQNHLYNATITNENFPTEYVGLILQDAKKDVLKWLY
ncbi:MAG TPA: hypothetical protein VFM70_04655 [Salinimicrobium sp.]|nr:hypothetical protein [Salinimicrobium sp.]